MGTLINQRLFNIRFVDTELERPVSWIKPLQPNTVYDVCIDVLNEGLESEQMEVEIEIKRVYDENRQYYNKVVFTDSKKLTVDDHEHRAFIFHWDDNGDAPERGVYELKVKITGGCLGKEYDPEEKTVSFDIQTYNKIGPHLTDDGRIKKIMVISMDEALAIANKISSDEKWVGNIALFAWGIATCVCPIGEAFDQAFKLIGLGAFIQNKLTGLVVGALDLYHGDEDVKNMVKNGDINAMSVCVEYVVDRDKDGTFSTVSPTNIEILKAFKYNDRKEDIVALFDSKIHANERRDYVCYEVDVKNETRHTEKVKAFAYTTRDNVRTCFDVDYERLKRGDVEEMKFVEDYDEMDNEKNHVVTIHLTNNDGSKIYDIISREFNF